MSTIRDPEGEELRVLSALASWRGKDVLEVGSGDGRLSLDLATSARSLLAIDPDEEAVAVARRRLPARLVPKVEMRAEDIGDTDLPEGEFDVAVLSWSL